MRYPAQFGKYLLLHRINVGGMAEVFVAKTFGIEGFERLVAIKCLLPRHCADSRFLEMFVDEAHIAVSLNHANIVPVYELGEVEGQYYIAMEYVLGKDLRQIIDDVRQQKLILPVAASIHMAARVCDGLDYAHRRVASDARPMNVVHRDVNPQNVLCSYDGEVKLTDFGIAKAERRISTTEAGMLKGKFGYMSPEQIAGEELDRRSDIFAVGILLYELTTGHAAFEGDTDYDTLERARAAEFTPPISLNRRIPQELSSILEKALARDPADRFQFASEMSEELQSILVSRGRIYNAKRLNALLRTLYRGDMVDDRLRYDEYMRVRAAGEIEPEAAPESEPEPPAEEPDEVEKAAREALADLFTMLPTAGETTPPASAATILPVRVYLDGEDAVDATTTMLSETSIQLVSAASLKPGTDVQLWVQTPQNITGLNVRGRVSSVVQSGGQNGIGVELVFDSTQEKERFAQQVRPLIVTRPDA